MNNNKELKKIKKGSKEFVKELDLEKSKMNIPYAGQKTPDAFDPFKPYLDDKKLGDNSPMTKISRPAKPRTGAMG